MKINFFKYQGTGNDFVMIDNRSLSFPKENISVINALCNRQFGIGADGLILIENDSVLDFKMIYFNADGNEGSMCGNGGRCTVAFAKKLGIISNSTHFNAVDGEHYATINTTDVVSLQMIDVKKVEVFDDYVFLNTGSPHHVQIVNHLADYDVFNNGKEIRYSNLYGMAGSNINFVEKETESKFSVRTYERGVENETLSCGTGVTATAIAMYHINKTKSNSIELLTKGGSLNVSFNFKDNTYTNIFLTGAATFVFNGIIEV